MKTTTTAMSALLGLALFVGTVVSVETARASHLSQVGLIEYDWDGVAIKGYDPVAYFEMGAAMEGSEEFSAEWLGQNWYFANAQHRDLFIADPVRYAPQYGGYCSESHNVANINPSAWRIVGERLYIFYSEDSAGKFETDERAQSMAEKYWKRVQAGLTP